SGHATWQDAATGPQGGRPARVCVLTDSNQPDTRHNPDSGGDEDGGNDGPDNPPNPPDNPTEPPNPTQPPTEPCEKQALEVVSVVSGCRVAKTEPTQTPPQDPVQPAQDEGEVVSGKPVVSGVLSGSEDDEVTSKLPPVPYIYVDADE